MANDTTTFTLDLDADQFLGKMDQAISSVTNLSESGAKVSSLIAQLEALGPVLGVIAIAVASVGAAFEAAFTTEHIEAVTRQFDILSQKSGVYANDLKKALVDSGNGWATETELMESANKAMLGLESGVNRLPELMNLARNAAILMGGSMVEKFELITRAVETGNTRYLRQLNIIVDQQKAYEQYASKIGTVVSALSLAEKQQAVLNAVLDQTKGKFDGMTDGLNKTSELWNKLKTDAKEFGEKIMQSISGVAVPAVRGLIVAMDDLIHVTTNIMSGNLKFWKPEFWHDQKTSMDGVTKSINDQTAALQNQGKAAPPDLEKRAAQEAKAAKDLEAIQSQLTQAQIKNMSTVEEAQRLYDVERINDAQKIAAQEQQIMASKDLTRAQKEQQIATLHQVMNQKMIQDDEKLEQMDIQASQRRLANETRVDQQVANAAHVNALKASNAWKQSGGVGAVAMGSFQSNAVTAFQKIGSGAETASQAMKEAFMGMLGEMATKQGEFMMLDSFKTFPAINAPEFAAGAALVALGGALGAAASSSTPSAGGGGGGSSSGGDLGIGANTTAIPTTSAATQQPKVSTNLIIQGSLVTNDQTARWLVDQIRNAADSTDFTIRSVNGGFS